MDQLKKYDLVRDIAVAIQKHEMRISVPTLVSLLNDNEILTSYGTEYQGGRGSYKFISSAYKHFSDNNDAKSAEAIALAFPTENGSYAYDK